MQAIIHSNLNSRINGKPFQLNGSCKVHGNSNESVRDDVKKVQNVSMTSFNDEPLLLEPVQTGPSLPRDLQGVRRDFIHR